MYVVFSVDRLHGLRRRSVVLVSADLDAARAMAKRLGRAGDRYAYVSGDGPVVYMEGVDVEVWYRAGQIPLESCRAPFSPRLSDPEDVD